MISSLQHFGAFWADLPGPKNRFLHYFVPTCNVGPSSRPVKKNSTKLGSDVVICDIFRTTQRKMPRLTIPSFLPCSKARILDYLSKRYLLSPDTATATKSDKLRSPNTALLPLPRRDESRSHATFTRGRGATLKMQNTMRLRRSNVTATTMKCPIQGMADPTMI